MSLPIGNSSQQSGAKVKLVQSVRNLQGLRQHGVPGANENETSATNTILAPISTTSGSAYVGRSHFKVMKTYEQLSGLIDGLSGPSGSLSKIIEYQENEFISSYRVNMLQVAMELKELQTRIETEEQYNDSVMNTVEEGCTWYKNQTKRLLKDTESLLLEASRTERRMEELTEQKLYLTTQLKAEMKRNKLMEAELLALHAPLDVSISESLSFSRSQDFAEDEVQLRNATDILAHYKHQQEQLRTEHHHKSFKKQPSLKPGLQLSPIVLQESRPSSRPTTGGILQSAEDYMMELENFNKTRSAMEMHLEHSLLDVLEKVRRRRQRASK